MFAYNGQTFLSRSPHGLKIAGFVGLNLAAFLIRDPVLLALLGCAALLLLLGTRYTALPKLAGALGLFLAITDFWFLVFFSATPLDLYSLILLSNLRMSVLFFSTALFVYTTDPYSVISVLKWLRVPESVALSVYVVLRFLPELEKDFNEVVLLQKTRQITWKHPWVYLKSLLVPLCFIVIDRANELAIAYYLREKRNSIQSAQQGISGKL